MYHRFKGDKTCGSETIWRVLQILSWEETGLGMQRKEGFDHQDVESTGQPDVMQTHPLLRVRPIGPSFTYCDAHYIQWPFLGWLWPAKQPFLAFGHCRLGTLKAKHPLSRPYLCYWMLQRWLALSFERPCRPRATLQGTCGCYFIYALSFFILTLKLLCSRVRALYIVRRNVNRGLLLCARGNVIQKQFEGNCKVMWPREPEAIETLNIISGQYNMFCRAAWKNRKTLLGQSLEN